MLHRSLRLAATILAVVCSASALGQAAPAQFFVVCGSQPSEPTVYFSGVLQGPATAFAGFRAGFSDFLTQRYAYKGAVGCLPARDAAQAQKFIADRSSALRSAKKTVVDTSWTEAAAAAAPAPPAPAAKAGVAAPAARSATASSATSGGSASNASSFATALGTIFGAGGAAGAAAGGTNAPAGAGDKSAAAKSTAGSGASGASGQSPFEQVSNTLTAVFGNKPAGGAAATDAGSKDASGSSEGGLGSAQSGSTKLVVDGCGRQDKRVACVTELTNQNQKDTLVQAKDVWTDAFIVDDRGDRHARTSAFFLNIDGEQRPQLDISYGKTARFILMFDEVPTKVQKVTLRSASASLDVEDVSLIAPSSQGTQHH